MTSPSEPRTPRLYHAGTSSQAFSPSVAIAIVFAAMATLIVLGMIVFATGVPLYVALALGQLVMLALPWLMARRTGRSMAALGLRLPAARYVAAAALIGSSAWYLNMRLVELLPLPEGDQQQIVELVDRPALAIVLLAVALAPAICEEVLFRGVLLRAFASRMPAIVAVLASAAVFSLYHLRPIQMVPTFTLGVVLAVIALRADSVVPTMLAHLLNNAIALMVVRDELPQLSRGLAGHPDAALAGATIACGAGVMLAMFDAIPRRRVA